MHAFWGVGPTKPNGIYEQTCVGLGCKCVKAMSVKSVKPNINTISLDDFNRGLDKFMEGSPINGYYVINMDMRQFSNAPLKTN